MIRSEIPVIVDGKPSWFGKSLMAAGFLTAVASVVYGAVEFAQSLRTEAYTALAESYTSTDIAVGIGGLAVGALAFGVGLRHEDRLDS